MHIHVHHHIHIGDDTIALLKQLLEQQTITNQKLSKLMADLTQLTADVAKLQTVEASAVTLLQGLKSQLDAAGTDPAKLKALSDSIEASTNDLAAAVAANTPAAPATSGSTSSSGTATPPTGETPPAGTTNG